MLRYARVLPLLFLPADPRPAHLQVEWRYPSRTALGPRANGIQYEIRAEGDKLTLSINGGMVSELTVLE
jgi:hypothetical protein